MVSKSRAPSLIKLWDESTTRAAAPTNSPAAAAGALTGAASPAGADGSRGGRHEFDVYVVGGFVRDLMLDIVSQRALTLDVDIVIEGDAIAFPRRMQHRYGGRIVEHRTLARPNGCSAATMRPSAPIACSPGWRAPTPPICRLISTL